MLFSVRLCLFSNQNLPGMTVNRPQAQDILAAECSDRSINDDGFAGALTNFSRQVHCEARALVFAHLSQGLRYLRIR